MYISRRLCLKIWMTFLFSCSWVSSPARAGLVADISSSVTPQPGGLNLYQYTITDEPSSSLPAVEFTLTVDASANLTSITGASGWLITYSTSDNIVDWSSPSSSTDLQPGNSAIFSFVSPLGAFQQNYQIVGLTTNPFAIDTKQGQIASPGIASVPEPGSLVLFGIGTLGVLTMLARRRRCR